jgi:hypothetical protein
MVKSKGPQAFKIRLGSPWPDGTLAGQAEQNRLMIRDKQKGYWEKENPFG